jgi:hypothetical protein
LQERNEYICNNDITEHEEGPLDQWCQATRACESHQLRRPYCLDTINDFKWKTV